MLSVLPPLEGIITELQVPAKKPERKNAKRPNAVRGLP
jgi:hypothetical protein